MVLTMLLVCAVAASLAFGVLLAYGVCLGMFEAFKMHAQQVAGRRLSAVQGAAAQAGR